MRSWNIDDQHRMAEFLRCQREFWGSFTPLERDCLFKINMQETLGEAIDPIAQKTIQDKRDRHTERWRKRNAAKRGPRNWYIV